MGLDDIPDSRNTTKKLYEVENKNFSIEEFSKKFSVSASTIRDRLRRGASIKQAINLEEIKKGELITQKEVLRNESRKIKLKVDGKTFTSYSSLAKKYNLTDYVVRQRIVNYGYTPEEAVKEDFKNKPIIVNGIKYSNRVKVAEAYELTPEVLNGRLSKGYSILEAVGIEVKKSSRNVEYEGTVYQNLNQFSAEIDIPYNILDNRMRSGMTLSEAVLAGDKITNSGRYNLTILNRNPVLAQTPAFLYFVEMKINGIDKYKIGITTQTVEKRLKPEQINFKVIKTVSGSLLQCYKLEQDLHKLLSDKRDLEISSDMLDGYSEIFNLSMEDVNIVLDLIS